MNGEPVVEPVASVSLDLIVRALLAAGASRKDVEKAFVAIE